MLLSVVNLLKKEVNMISISKNVEEFWNDKDNSVLLIYGAGIAAEIIIEMAETDADYSVMMRGCCSNYITKKDFKFLSTSYDNLLEKLFIERGRLQQKEVLN